MLYYPVYNENFYDEAKKYDAEFTEEALDALYEYYNEQDEYIEMDMVRLKNEWTEYESWEEASEALILIKNDDVKLKTEDDYRNYVELSGYSYLECENGNILVKDGIW